MIARKPEKWRFCGGCYCYIVKKGTEKDDIYFAAPDRKKLCENLLKQIKTSTADWTDLWINNEEEFKLRLSEDGINLEINHPEFPNPEKWYVIKNWLLEENVEVKIEELIKILHNINYVNGEFEGKFIPIFSDDLPKSVSFTHEGLPAYEEIMEEAERRLSVEFGKKTTKWIPGHRYDTEERSYYFFRTAYSRIVGRGKSGGSEKYLFKETDISTIESAPMFLFLTKTPKDETKIWDNVVVSLEERRKNLNYLDVLQKKVSGVDYGTWTNLEESKIISSVKDWRIKIIKNTLENCCKIQEEICGIEVVRYTNLNYLFEPLYLYLGDGDEKDMKKIGEYVNPILLPVLKNVIDEIIGKNYDYIHEEVMSDDKKIDYIISILLSGYVKDLFYNKAVLVATLLGSLGIELRDLVEEQLKNFNWDDIIKVWDKYLVNNNLIPSRDKNVDLRTFSSRGSYYQPQPVSTPTLSDAIPNDLLREIVLDTIKWSESNYRTGIDLYKVLPGFRKSDPDYMEILVTVPNIINRLEIQGIPLTDDLKNAIMSSNFWTVFITAPKNIDWSKEY